MDYNHFFITGFLSVIIGGLFFKNKNPKTKSEKLELKKYDPKVRKHVVFKEQKIK